MGPEREGVCRYREWEGGQVGGRGKEGVEGRRG